MSDLKTLTNNLKKFVSSLKLRKNREESHLFIAEGLKLCNEVFNSNYKTEFIVVRSGFSKETEKLLNQFLIKGVDVYISRKQQFDQLCETKTPQDILAVVRMSEKENKAQGPFIALDGISDPGNLGTIIRTADWFGFSNIILGNSSVDKFNSKTIRASMGSFFRMNIITAKNLSEFIKSNYPDYDIYGACLDTKLKMEKIKPNKNFGLVFGNESNGISKETETILTKKFIISGFGRAESLNVGVSVGIALYYFSNFNKIY
ncbi:MAG: RNA methyltransferase [Candidatus Kapabacteria bacterium]|nr:RNA methyltransferase [Candidatus Kapabacteria bacterium]